MREIRLTFLDIMFNTLLLRNRGIIILHFLKSNCNSDVDRNSSVNIFDSEICLARNIIYYDEYYYYNVYYFLKL